MIRFNLRKLLDQLEKLGKRKVTLKEISEKSGCDKNALSRLVNHPDVIPSATVIDKLVQYFFFELLGLMQEGNKRFQKSFMNSIVADFVTVYPDRSEYWDILPAEIKENPNPLSLDAIWSIYERISIPDRDFTTVSPDNSTRITSIIPKLLQARTRAREKGEAEVTLTSHELDTLVKYLPLILTEGHMTAVKSKTDQRELDETSGKQRPSAETQASKKKKR